MEVLVVREINENCSNWVVSSEVLAVNGKLEKYQAAEWDDDRRCPELSGLTVYVPRGFAAIRIHVYERLYFDKEVIKDILAIWDGQWILRIVERQMEDGRTTERLRLSVPRPRSWEEFERFERMDYAVVELEEPTVALRRRSSATVCVYENFFNDLDCECKFL